MPCGHPVNRGAYPSLATGRGVRSPGIAPQKRHPKWVKRGGRLMRRAVDSPPPHRLRLGGSPLRGKRCAFVQVALQPSATLPAMRHGNHGMLTATGQGEEAAELLHKKGTRLGVAARPLADLTAPLAPGRGRGIGSEVSSPLGAREPKGLRRRLRPLRPGFRVCSTTAIALRAPGKPGSKQWVKPK